MKARHKKARGGVVYSGAGSNVIKEAEEKKRGGSVKEMGKVMGHKGKMRLDKRARGGKIGADKSPMAPSSSKHPFSSAAR